MNNVKEKIRKLLAKATSQNEHEAQAALLKARELMARYKLTDKEIGDAPSANRKLTRARYEEKHFSSKTRGWYLDLATIIAEHHCCQALMNGSKTSRKKWVCFVGLDDDPSLCLEIFTYAVKHIEDRIKKERKNINTLYSWDDVRRIVAKQFELGYAKGFMIGLHQKYEEQFIQPNTESFGLIMVIPQEVTDYVKTVQVVQFDVDMKNGMSADAYVEGKQAGYKFNPVKEITARGGESNGS